MLSGQPLRPSSSETDAPRGLPRIAGTATAVPPHTLEREQVKEYIQKVFELSGRRLESIMAVIDHAQIDRRHAIFPVDYIIEPRSLATKSAEYQEHALRLGQEAAERCLAAAGMAPVDVDLIITVSCTGFMIPSLDAYLINSMGFRANVRRLPLTELGCAAGAMALARAADHVRAFPDHTVLIIAVELATLTFQRGDVSQANLISCTLFGDGAAAAVVTGRPASGPAIIDSLTYTFPESLDAMGFDLRDTGFHIVLSKDVPQLVRGEIRRLVDCFLQPHGLSRATLQAFLLHPGGQKLLSYVAEQLELNGSQTELSWDVLRHYGNLSSATILFILHACLRRNALRRGDHGLAVAFGPGFSAEFLLLRWL